MSYNKSEMFRVPVSTSLPGTITDSSENDSRICFLTSSSDGSEDLISPETELFISKLKSAVIIPLLFLFGGPANVLNMMVFFKQGLQDRVSLCLFCLAVVDFTTVTFSFVLFAEQMFMFSSPERYGQVFQTLTHHKVLLFYNTGYGATFLSTITACERCLFVLMPLRARLLLKTKYMSVIVLTTVPIVCFLRLVVTAKYDVRCVFDEKRQVTFADFYITDYAARNKELLDFVDGIFYGFFISLVCPVIILISTFITTVELWRIASWRRETASVNTKKELAVTKMLILLSTEFLIFTLPRVLLRAYPLFNADFSAKGKYGYFYFAFVSVADVCVCMGAAFSFIVYYFSSSRYRNILANLFRNDCFRRVKE